HLLRRPDDALALHERALRLNPNLALAWNFSGAALLYAGRTDEASERLDRYKVLTPAAPLAWMLDGTRVLAQLLRRDHEAAAKVGREAIELHTGSCAACKPTLAALGHLGRRTEADAVRRRLLRIEPSFSVRRFLTLTPLLVEADREHVAEGLRRAGLAE
ncbi:MAG: hypothetical protein JO326_13715, partial [Acetobacteraceae bacterium]|nr:hypothetical protein [Acetobacteraceae bacterium]